MKFLISQRLCEGVSLTNFSSNFTDLFLRSRSINWDKYWANLCVNEFLAQSFSINKHSILIEPFDHVLETLFVMFRFHGFVDRQKAEQSFGSVVMSHQSLIIWVSESLNNFYHWLKIIEMESKSVSIIW